MAFSSCTSKLYLLILDILKCFCDDWIWGGLHVVLKNFWENNFQILFKLSRNKTFFSTNKISPPRPTKMPETPLVGGFNPFEKY